MVKVGSARHAGNSTHTSIQEDSREESYAQPPKQNVAICWDIDGQLAYVICNMAWMGGWDLNVKHILGICRGLIRIHRTRENDPILYVCNMYAWKCQNKVPHFAQLTCFTINKMKLWKKSQWRKMNTQPKAKAVRGWIWKEDLNNKAPSGVCHFNVLWCHKRVDQ